VDSFSYATISHRWDEVFKLLSNNNFPHNYLSLNSNCETALATACKINDTNTVKKLLELGCDPLAPCGEAAEENTIVVAAAFGMVDSLKLVLDQQNNNINSKVLTQALLRAVYCSSGFDPNLNVEESYWRNRSQAEKDKSLECIELLLIMGANPLEFDNYNLTPYFVATQYGDCSLIQKFVDHYKHNSNIFSLDAPHSNGITTLMEVSERRKR